MSVGASDADFAEKVALLDAVYDDRERPPVVLYGEAPLGAARQASTLGARTLVLHGSEAQRLPSAIREAALDPAFQEVAGLLDTVVSSIALRTALRKLILQKPLEETDAAELSQGDPRRFVRRVSDLPALAGCSLSHLEAEASKEGIRPRSVVRCNSSFHGAARLRQGSVRPLSIRLNFPTPDALRTRLRRTYRKSLHELRIMPLRELVVPLIQSLRGHHAKAARQRDGGP